MSPGITGAAYVVKPLPEFDTDIVIDSHSHIQSGACAPLPLLWNRPFFDITRPSRWLINTMGPLLIGKVGDLQKKTTEAIGDAFVQEISKTFASTSALRKAAPYKKATSIFAPAFIMPMDMDFAHIAGFPTKTSSTIYHEGMVKKWIDGGPYMPPKQIEVEGVYYYDRQDALAPEENGVQVNISDERPEKVWLYQNYIKQHAATKTAVKNNPWSLIPLFHYDPRRWCKPSGSKVDETGWKTGPWDFPFSKIATAKRAGLFIGFKMYPPLGYKPLDPRLPYLHDFYLSCIKENIPILTHCSPGGMTTHEAKLYYKLDGKTLTPHPELPPECTYDPDSPIGYFYDNYVHPRNWREVLNLYPNLKLCLAHLGGDEMAKMGHLSGWVQEIISLCTSDRFCDVYTDMSCYEFGKGKLKDNVTNFLREVARKGSRYQKLQDKLIFGVDWYLTMLPPGDKDYHYKKYVDSFFEVMNSVDKWQWYRSAIVNPARFYGLDNQALIENMNTHLDSLIGDEDKAKSILRINNFKRIKNIRNQIDVISNELEKLKA